MPSIIKFVAILLFFDLTNSAKYTAIPDDEQIFKPCEGEEDHSITSFFDLSNVTFNYVSDDEVIVDGYFTAIADIKSTDTLWATVEIFREVRGQYILPTVEIKRKNVCQAVFNPIEVWYTYSSKLDKKYQICPNVKGTIYGISNWSSKQKGIVLPDPELSGAYRTFIHGGVNGNPAVSICAVLDFHLFLISL